MSRHADTLALLESHRDRLRAAAAMTGCQLARTSALQLLRRVNGYLAMGGDLSCIAGMVGANGYGPAIEDAIRDCEARPMERFTEAVPTPIGFLMKDAA